ncbi:integrase arm-type DNA-binding domain-containing protein [Rodentibacter myodis]|uniref:Preprotein translocase n=1 Tax=Rodentibacter myodis TaxID=1907939 RepID=A0A1V3JS61_9PAST|nr:integrase arm-type DNA-binding domain-containing protein [Rodentibacter myodis]OOF59485.1 preprotein translocase [Rodentibacter myodis]
MARITKPLTNTEVERAKPKSKDYKLMDGQGLFLLIKSKGSKLWRFRYVKPFSTKQTDLSLGTYPDISLSQARKVRDEFLSLLAQNIDPQQYRQQQNTEEQERLINTLFAVAEKWRDKKAPEVLPKTMEKNWGRLEKHLFPKLGQMPISSITPKLLIEALNPLKERGISDTLQRIIRLVNEILNFAVNGGLIEFNKCVNVALSFSTPTTENNPTIRPEALPEFLSDLRDSNSSLQVKILIKWQLLTMVRPKEAVSAEWAEIDFNQKLWAIPAEKMKGGKRGHIVPLSSQAIKLLDKMKNLTGGGQYVFQSELKPNQSMNPQTANRAIKLLAGRKYTGKLTAHGLRAIASTYLNEQLINYDVVEACLSHTIADQTRKAYNRSDYLEQRIEVMQLWGDYVERCSMVVDI